MRHDYRDLHIDDFDRVPYCLCGWVGRPGDTYERHQAFIKHLGRLGIGGDDGIDFAPGNPTCVDIEA